jgi:hypothetical protein
MRDNERRPSSVPEAEGEEPERGKKWARSHQSIMEDGQLGGANLDRGPERANPEGTSLTPNPPEDRR